MVLVPKPRQSDRGAQNAAEADPTAQPGSEGAADAEAAADDQQIDEPAFEDQDQIATNSGPLGAADDEHGLLQVAGMGNTPTGEEPAEAIGEVNDEVQHSQVKVNHS